MLQRKQRRNLTPDKKSRALYQEIDYYRGALNLLPSPTTHCYVAECRLEEKRLDEARSHLRQALLMAPEHVLANRLAKQISGLSRVESR